ncbi:hypothetical protein [Chelatococcus sp. XZ-Ab1]|uniref:hypothetical protein n=1 Tax=Chelatococcus sp. XZ-Ab1 TaxID=3034027 RepID=UPI0023E45F2D|nr:hypothetical protein [Chelatococcus sp. XZ-Ab1]
MSGSSHIAPPLFGGIDTRYAPVSEAVCALARRLWPRKTQHHLAARAGTSHRSAEKWLTGECGLSADALANLIRSDVGIDVLEGLMGDVKPSWWPEFRAQARIAAAEARLEALAKEIANARRDLA